MSKTRAMKFRMSLTKRMKAAATARPLTRAAAKLTAILTAADVAAADVADAGVVDVTATAVAAAAEAAVRVRTSVITGVTKAVMAAGVRTTTVRIISRVVAD